MTNPLRKTGLFSTDVDGQTLIYDSTSHQTHCLNPLALQVWALCDGRHSRNAMVRTLTADLRSVDAEDLVDAALDRFAALGMLADNLPTRRAIGKTAAKALAAGLVLSVLMPTRAAAGSVTCETLLDAITCTVAGCEWSAGTCITPGTSSPCEGMDEDQCGTDAACTWVGICVAIAG